MSATSGSPTGRYRGLVFAVLSCATFATSGSFGSALLDDGWTPGAAVTVRIALAAALLTPFALVQLRGRWRVLWTSAGVIAGFGLIGCAGCQLFYFTAVEHLTVGVALLLEYLASILIVGWLWLRRGQRPRRLTLAGAGLAMLGLVLVLNLTSAVRISAVGVVWGLLAAVSLAAYFFLVSASAETVPPFVLAWAGMTVGAVALGLLGLVRVLPVRASTGEVRLAGHAVSWVVPVIGLSLVAAAFAYVTSIVGARLLGPKVASFVGLSEVLFAVLFAWLLLDQLPAVVQLVGGVLIVAGVVLVRVDELRVQPLGEAGPASTAALPLSTP